MIRSIHVYDFDNTLMSTPFPDEAIPAWEAITGRSFPAGLFWTMPESLDPRLDITPNHEVVASAERSHRDPTVLSIMMTGRRNSLRDAVMQLIDLHDLLLFDSYYLADGDTLTYKLNKIRELFDAHENVDEIMIWDDRESHWSSFEQLSQELGIPVYVNRVIDGNIQ